MVLRVLGSCLVFAVLSVACGTPQAPTCTGTQMRMLEAGTLTVAADYSYPPFAFRSKKGDLVGFDIDMMKAVANQMGLEVRFLNRGVGSIVPGALAHRHDVGASGLRETEQLRAQACLSAPYLDADLGILVVSPEPSGVAGASDLEGLKVGVLDGSRAEEWADENLAGSMLASLPTTDDLLAAVRTQQLDAVVDELAIVRFAARQSRAFAVAGRIETDESFVFVAAPDNGELIEQVDAALARLETNGVRVKIERKWFGGP